MPVPLEPKERVLLIKSINDVTCWATVEFTSFLKLNSILCWIWIQEKIGSRAK